MFFLDIVFWKLTPAKQTRFGRPEIRYFNAFENVYKDWKCGKIKAIDAIKEHDFINL